LVSNDDLFSMPKTRGARKGDLFCYPADHHRPAALGTVGSVAKPVRWIIPRQMPEFPVSATGNRCSAAAFGNHGPDFAKAQVFGCFEE